MGRIRFQILKTSESRNNPFPAPTLTKQAQNAGKQGGKTLSGNRYRYLVVKAVFGLGTGIGLNAGGQETPSRHLQLQAILFVTIDQDTEPNAREKQRDRGGPSWIAIRQSTGTDTCGGARGDKAG